jgi:L-amino acid N-acyltransferase YncA
MTIQVSKINSVKDPELKELPGELSFFEPFLLHEVKESLEAGGEVYLSSDSEGKNGLFIYDNYEMTGTIFTKSREVFDYFYKLKPSSYIFSELEASDLPKEVWNLWQLDVTKAKVLDHRFRYHVSMESDRVELEKFTAKTQPETNVHWVRVALENGDKCFVTKIGNRIVGIAWMEIVDGFARSHGLYVEPQFRKKGIMKDNFEARLIYLKSRSVHTLINEIAESNLSSVSHATKIGEKVVGKIYLYASPDAQK